MSRDGHKSEGVCLHCDVHKVEGFGKVTLLSLRVLFTCVAVVSPSPLNTCHLRGSSALSAGS